jgi:hypothetical protein
MGTPSNTNVDARVAQGFGDEWSTFRQDEAHVARAQREAIFNGYFAIFPWNMMRPGTGISADVDCDTGRWAMLVAPRAAHLHLIDAGPDALAIARQNLKGQSKVTFHSVAIRSSRELPV